MAGWAGAAGALLGAEVCAPLLLLCWLCCWPDDGNSESGSRHRSNELFGRRFASSAVSLHLPSTSGHTKQPLSAHRSHEEIRRRKSHHESGDQEARYHSAPSVIDEVLHRRDWERSTRELHIPLRPDTAHGSTSTIDSIKNSSDEDFHEKTDEQIVGRTCKKHYTNIKSSKNSCKESNNNDIKDEDLTENASNFYIGDTSCQLGDTSTVNNDQVFDEIRQEKSPHKAKDAKQTLNESIKAKDRPRTTLVPLAEFQMSAGFDVDDLDDIAIDRSGAVHHSVESRSSLFGTHAIPFPPPSVEAVGYESDASYLDDVGMPAGAAASVMGGVAGSAVGGAVGGAGGLWGRGARARHASAGDVLAPSLTLRPQSAALSESDLDFDLEGCDEPPPAYDEVQLLATIDRKETAI